MTVGLTQTSTVVVSGAQPGGRGARQAAGSGFDEALGSLGHGPREPSPAGHVKAASGAHAQRHHRVRDDAPASTDRGDGVGKAHRDDPLAGTEEHLIDALAAGAVDSAEELGSQADSGEDTGLPTQMRAEQVITALMAIAPVERRAGSAGEAVGKPKAAGPDAEEPAATELGKTRAGQVRASGSFAASATSLRETDAAATSKPADTAGLPQPTGTAAATGDHATRAAAKVMHKAEAGGGARTEGQTIEGHAEVPRQSEASSEPTTGNANGGKGESRSDTSGERDRAPEARRGDPLPGSAKVSVVAQQAAPAPAAAQLGANATAIVTAIASEQGWRPSNASADSLQAFRNAQPMRSLKIELHPAELGTVTANLRTAGEQMSVELQVENREAYDRLSADSEAIVKSLRSLGYDIDRVSIQQPQAATTGVQRADVSANTGSFSRDASSFQSDNQGNGGERLGGQAGGRDGGNEGQHNGQTHEARQDRAGGGIYI